MYHLRARFSFSCLVTKTEERTWERLTCCRSNAVQEPTHYNSAMRFVGPGNSSLSVFETFQSLCPSNLQVSPSCGHQVIVSARVGNVRIRSVGGLERIGEGSCGSQGQEAGHGPNESSNSLHASGRKDKSRAKVTGFVKVGELCAASSSITELLTPHLLSTYSGSFCQASLGTCILGSHADLVENRRNLPNYRRRLKNLGNLRSQAPRMPLLRW